MFDEKAKEKDHKTGQDLEVWQSPKYKESRAAAIQLMKDKPFIKEGDFWILMNKTRSGKMAYTGLIISHNGCLKINDNAEQKFKPECVTVTEAGYNNSLVFTYISAEQGIYEVGEVTPKNCSNDYPYAMALKRCFDRVVLKLCKLAFYGIYSDSEADEFKEKPDIKEIKDKDANIADEISTRFQSDMDKVEPIPAELIKKLREGCFVTGTEETVVAKAFKAKTLEELTEKQAKRALKRLNEKADKS